VRSDKKSPLKSDKKSSKISKKGAVGYNKKSALLEDAITQMNAGKYGRASSALKELLALDPLNAEGRRLFATLHLRLGSLISARTAFESLAREALDRQDYWLAESLLREYLIAGPRCVPFLEMLGHVYEEKGDAMAAVAEYGKAIEVLFEDPDADHPDRPNDLFAKIRHLAPASPVAFRLAAMFDPETGQLVRPAASKSAPADAPVAPSETPVAAAVVNEQPSGSKGAVSDSANDRPLESAASHPPAEKEKCSTEATFQFASSSMTEAVTPIEEPCSISPPASTDTLTEALSLDAPVTSCPSASSREIASTVSRPAITELPFIASAVMPPHHPAEEASGTEQQAGTPKSTVVPEAGDSAGTTAEHHPLQSLHQLTSSITPSVPLSTDQTEDSSAVSPMAVPDNPLPGTKDIDLLPTSFDVMSQPSSLPISQAPATPAPMPWDQVQECPAPAPDDHHQVSATIESAAVPGGSTVGTGSTQTVSSDGEPSSAALSWDDILNAVNQFRTPIDASSPPVLEGEVAALVPPIAGPQPDPMPAPFVQEPNVVMGDRADASAFIAGEAPIDTERLPAPMPWEQVEHETVNIPRQEREPEFGSMPVTTPPGTDDPTLILHTPSEMHDPAIGEESPADCKEETSPAEIELRILSPDHPITPATPTIRSIHIPAETLESGEETELRVADPVADVLPETLPSDASASAHSDVSDEGSPTQILQQATTSVDVPVPDRCPNSPIESQPSMAPDQPSGFEVDPAYVESRSPTANPALALTEMVTAEPFSLASTEPLSAALESSTSVQDPEPSHDATAIQPPSAPEIAPDTTTSPLSVTSEAPLDLSTPEPSASPAPAEPVVALSTVPDAPHAEQQPIVQGTCSSSSGILAGKPITDAPEAVAGVERRQPEPAEMPQSVSSASETSSPPKSSLAVQQDAEPASSLATKEHDSPESILMSPDRDNVLSIACSGEAAQDLSGSMTPPPTPNVPAPETPTDPTMAPASPSAGTAIHILWNDSSGKPAPTSSSTGMLKRWLGKSTEGTSSRTGNEESGNGIAASTPPATRSEIAASAVDVLFDRPSTPRPLSAEESVPKLRSRKPVGRSAANRVRMAATLFVRNCFSTTRSLVVLLAVLVGLAVACVAVVVGAAGLTWILLDQRPNAAFQNMTSVPQRTLQDPSKNGYFLLLGFSGPTNQDPLLAGFERKVDESDVELARGCLDGEGNDPVARQGASAEIAGKWFQAADPALRFKTEASSIKSWIGQADVSMSRYRQWLRLPFEDWGYGQGASPNCGLILYTHRLYVAEGFAVDQDTGVERLEGDLGAWRSVLGHAKTLPVKMLASTAMNDDVAVISGLLLRLDLDERLIGRLARMTRPLDQVEQSMRWPMQSQFVQAIKTLDQTLKQDKNEARPLYVSLAAAMPLPKQRRFNEYAEYYEGAGKAASEGRYTNLPKRRQFVRSPAEGPMDYLFNPIENLIGVEPLPAWETYGGRVLETDARLRLAGLQAWLRRTPSEQDLLMRIAKAGQNLYDPFTGLPMLVNLKHGLLYSVGRDLKDNDATGPADVIAQIPMMTSQDTKRSSKGK
jgi:hypothetical protein